MPQPPSTAAVASASLRAVLGNRGLRLIEGAWGAAVAGDAALLVALLVAAYAAGGALYVGLLGAVRMVPATVAGLSAAVPLARYRAERVLVAVALLRCLFAGLAIAVLALGAPIWLAFATAAVVATSGALVRPTQTALFPSLARTPSELVAANVVASAAEGTGTLVGPVVAGVAVAVAGPALGAALAAVLFLAGALAMLGVPAIEHRMRPASSHGVAAVADGLRILARRPGAAVVVGDFLGQTFVRGLLLTLVVVASIQLLGIGDAGVGWLNAAFGLGGLLGGLLALGLASRRDLPRVFAVSLSIWGLPLAFIAAWPLAIVGLLAMAVSGAANALLDVSGFTILQRGVSQAERPAVFGVVEAVAGGGVAAGSIVGSLLVAGLGPRVALAVAGAILPILAVVSWPVVSRLERQTVLRDDEIDILRAVRLFEPLPLDALERIAVAMTPVRFEPGAALMREGEPGDRYIVLTEGQVDVVRGGRPVAVSGPGEGVGEIALLRAVPRTATVMAMTQVEGFAIDCAVFRAVIVGPAVPVADALIAERLQPTPVAG